MPTTYAIPDGRTVMAATLYNGTGATQSISNSNNGVSFQPDLVWIKGRSFVSNNRLMNSIAGAGLSLKSNATSAEASNNCLTSFNTNGFTTDSSGAGDINQNGETFVGWQWKAGGTAVSNTAGTITSSVSANTTAGFSVVTYTGNGTSGATVGHGLGVAPSLIIAKSRSAVANWQVYHSGIPSMGTGFIMLNSTFGFRTLTSQIWNSTAPTSTVFTLGNDTDINGSGNTNVAYCFAPVAGYSAFGSYTGNGSTDGPFVYMGFRPRWFMSKRSDTAGNDWVIMDTSRNTYNVADQQLYADLSLATETNVVYETDFLSNGLKIRTSTASRNASGSTYIYMAFAEVPFKFANAR